MFVTYDTDRAIVNRWLSFDEAERVFQNNGFGIYSKALFRGTFDQCMAYDIAFSTTIPALFGLKPLDEIFDTRDLVPNISEGVVVRPNSSFIMNGDRVMFKKKNIKFIEKISSKMIRRKDYFTNSWEEMLLYITKARLLNVVSKIGENANVDNVTKDMTVDVLDDFEKENGKWWSKLSEEEKEKLTVKLQARVLKFVKRNLNK